MRFQTPPGWTTNKGLKQCWESAEIILNRSLEIFGLTKTNYHWSDYNRRNLFKIISFIFDLSASPRNINFWVFNWGPLLLMITILWTKQNHTPQTILEYSRTSKKWTYRTRRSALIWEASPYVCRLDHDQVSACEGCNTHYLVQNLLSFLACFL